MPDDHLGRLKGCSRVIDLFRLIITQKIQQILLSGEDFTGQKHEEKNSKPFFHKNTIREL
jgi:hypothetical protein